MAQPAPAPAWQQAPVVASPGKTILTNPTPSWQMAPAAPSWEKKPDGNADAGQSLLGGIAEGAMNALGAFGNIREMAPTNAPNLNPLGIPDPFGWLPSGRDIKNGVQATTGYAPHQPQTDLGHVAFSAGSMIPSAAGALGGNWTGIPWAVTRAAGAGAVGGIAGNVAANTVGEQARPYAQLAGDILGGYGISKVGGTAARVATRASAPAAADLKATAQGLYDASSKAGILISHTTIDDIAKDVIKAGVDAGATPGLTDKAMAAITALKDRTAAGAPMTLEDLDKLRQVIAQAQSEGSPAASAMVSKFVDRINGLGPSDVVSGANPTDAVNYLNQAKAVWQQKSKAETVGKVISDAQLMQAEGPGRYPAALRAGFRKLARDPSFTKSWTPDEQYAIQTAAMGGGLMPALARWTGPVLGPAPVPVLNALGFGVKGIGNFGTTQAARYADALVRAGPNANPFTMVLPVPRTTRDLAAALVGGTVPFNMP